MSVCYFTGDKFKTEKRLRLHGSAPSQKLKIFSDHSSFIGFSQFRAPKFELSKLHKRMSHDNFIINNNNTDAYLRTINNSSPHISPTASPSGDNSTHAMDCEESNIADVNSIQVKTETTEECDLPIIPTLGTICRIEAPNFRYSNAFPLNFNPRHTVTPANDQVLSDNTESDPVERVSPTPYSVEINVTSEQPSPPPYNIILPYDSPGSDDTKLIRSNTDNIEVKQEFGDYYYCPISTSPPQTVATADSPESGHTASNSYSNLASSEDSGECIHSWSSNNGGE